MASSRSTKASNIKCNRTRIAFPVKDVVTGDDADHCFTPKEPIKESYAANILNEMYHTEFNEKNSEKRSLSHDDERFLKIMREGAVKDGLTHELPLPFRDEHVTFPDNRHLALGRLFSLKRQLIRKPDRLEIYNMLIC